MNPETVPLNISSANGSLCVYANRETLAACKHAEIVQVIPLKRHSLLLTLPASPSIIQDRTPILPT
jgi:hypothetical protein